MEFQAIVLAGGQGNRMIDISSSHPKCLLPIGNKPMIYYPVRMLEKAGFNEINIITLESIRSRVETELKVNCGIKANLHIVSIDDTIGDGDDDFGTANSLYLLKEKIVKDCMIVSCDLISNVSIQKMANFYRNNSASCVMLLSDNTEQYCELPATGTKGKYKFERDLFALDTDTNRLLFFGAETEIEEVKIKSSLIQKYPKITWTTNLQDAHFYILKKCLIDYIIDNNKIFSLKSEFFPYVIKKQFSSSVSKRHFSVSTKSETFQKIEEKHSYPKLSDYLKIDEFTKLVNRSSWKKNDPLSCYAFVQADGFCYRTNNLTIFAEANRQIMGKVMPHYLRERTVSSTGKSNQSIDSMIGDGTYFGEKALIKRSVIGKNCHIGEKSKITNSVVMDNVKIGEGVIIHGSIICSNSILYQKTEFKDCLVCYEQDVITTGKYSNETIKNVESYIDMD